MQGSKDTSCRSHLVWRSVSDRSGGLRWGGKLQVVAKLVAREAENWCGPSGVEVLLLLKKSQQKWADLSTLRQTLYQEEAGGTLPLAPTSGS